MDTPLNLPVSNRTVYVRPVKRSDLPEPLRDQFAPGAPVFAIHDADGTPLALTHTRNAAFAMARGHDFSPVSVH